MMRDYFDPIYYASSVRGPEPCPTPGSRPVKKSHSVVGHSSSSSSNRGGSGNVFGRFLKLGKSKSDVHWSSSKSRPSASVDDLEEDFRLSPSVLNRGPVEKMVHNSRKDVSRSHSWIYGSVKLPSDLPFGYGYTNNNNPNGFNGNSPSGNSSDNNHNHHTHALQIPRCQMSEYYAATSATCECTGEFDFLTGTNNNNGGGNGGKPCKACTYDWALGGGKKNRKGDSSADGGKTFVNSVRKLTWKSLKQVVKKRPSLDNMKKSSDIRVGGYESSQQNPFLSPEMGGGGGGVDGMMMMTMMGNNNGCGPNSPDGMMDEHSRMSGFFSYSQNAFSPDDLQPNYFFPAKKNMYASCTDIYGDHHHNPSGGGVPVATASVRMRPKPARQSWQFSNNNESGPVPNYQEDNGVYHSEWDLRQCIPYDVWVNTTSNVKPRTTLPPPRSKTPIKNSDLISTNNNNTSRNSSLSKSTSVPYLAEIHSNGISSSKKSYSTSSSSASILKVKSSSSGSVNNNNSDTISLRSVGSASALSIKTVGSTDSSCRQNGVVKRPSILSADVNAYQLLKAQTKNAKSPNQSNTSSSTMTTTNAMTRTHNPGVDDALSSSSDDLSDNALTPAVGPDSHMRIAGQKMYMPSNNKGKQTTKPSLSSSASFSNGKCNGDQRQINGACKNLNNNNMSNKRVAVRQGSLSSGDEWSDEMENNNNMYSQQSKHVPMNRDGNLQQTTGNKGITNNGGRNQIKTAQFNNKSQPRNESGGTRAASLNNGNYDNYRENNDFKSNTNNNTIMIENGNAVMRTGQSQTSSSFKNVTRSSSNNYDDDDGQSQTVHHHHQRDYEMEEEKYQVDFEEFVFEERKDEPDYPKNKSSCLSNGHNHKANDEENGNRNTEKQRTFIKNGQINGNSKRTESSKEVSPTSGGTLCGNNANNNANGPGKFGALRRRKSRNGANNPGKLLREVIYEEEVEHEQNHSGQAEYSISQQLSTSSMTSRCNGNNDGRNSQQQQENKEYAVKIVVSGTTLTDYVKPILKNRDRIYDSPLANVHNSADKEYNGNNNDIYFDSSVSTTSTTTSTLKKKVQFDQNKVIVCGGDSGPDSDDYGIAEHDDGRRNKEEEDYLVNQEKSREGAAGNYLNNEENTSCTNNEEMMRRRRNPSSSRYNQNQIKNGLLHPNQTSHDDATATKESVSLKSNLSRKSALSYDNSHDNSNQSQNQSLSSSEIKITQKIRSTFEEEVVRKANAFAIERSRKQVEAEKLEAAEKAATAKKEAENFSPSSATILSNDEECFESRKVNNLTTTTTSATTPVLNESRFTSSTAATSTNNLTKRKSNWKSSSSSSSSIPDPPQLPSSVTSSSITTSGKPEKDVGSGGSTPKERIFVKNSKVSHGVGVASQIMKAKRMTPLGKCSPNDEPSSSSPRQEKIINPNSLLFNDTTRIRLNQSRPSMNETFKLNLSTNGQGGSSNGSGSSGNGSSSGGKGGGGIIRLKQSNSFRTVGSTPLRPREPPPPPPPGSSKNGSSSSTTPITKRSLQMSISSSISGQLDKLLTTKSSSTSQIYASNLSLNNNSNGGGGNRLLLSKSEISLPMDLQTTYSNQASTNSRVIKNQSTHGQKTNGSTTISNHNNSNKSSGFEANGAKTSGRTSSSVVDGKKIIDGTNANSGSGTSKSLLSDRCEALDKMVGDCSNASTKTPTKTNYLLNSSKSPTSVNKTANNNNNNSRSNGNNALLSAKSEEIAGKMAQTTAKRGNLKSSSNNGIIIGATNSKQKSATKASSTDRVTTKHNDNDKHNIEIVTKENAVSEIRIYSSTSIAPSTVSKNGSDNKISQHHPTTTVNLVNRGGTGAGEVMNKQEIHYAATDILNNNNNPPPLPNDQITCPQSTSVVLIVDSPKVNGVNKNNCSKVKPEQSSSSPLTYSQPIDSLSRRNVLTSPHNNNPLPLIPNKQNDDDVLLPSSVMSDFPNTVSECINDLEEEPLYDDVIHHQNQTADNNNKATNHHGSLGRKFLMASLSSMNPSKKQLIGDNNPTTGEKHQSPLPSSTMAHVVSSTTLPCMACPPSLPPPNLPSKNLSEFANRPIVLKEDDSKERENLDEEVDNLYNDISEGVSAANQGQQCNNNSTPAGGGNSLQLFASSMKGALLNAIKSMDFDKRSIVSGVSSNHSGGSQNNNSNAKYDNNNGSGSIIGDGEEESCNLDNFIYDDTLSLRSGNSEEGSKSRFSLKSNNNKSSFPPAPSSIRSSSSTIKTLGNLDEQDENDGDPLYDDVINYSLKNKINRDSSDSGQQSDSAESEDAIPPPLPAQGPPKISTELPLLTFPLLLNRHNSNNASTTAQNEEKVIEILYPLSSSSSSSQQQKSTTITTPGKGHHHQGDVVLTRTRSLLNELNEKLSQLNSLSVEAAGVINSNNNNKSPLEFSTYSPPNKKNANNNNSSNNNNNVSSSSASSGVEEDYNSEKNYSLSNSSDGASGSSSSAEENYKLAQVTKLVTDTITMARGKFLDSMKTTNNNLSSLQSLNNSPTTNSCSNQVTTMMLSSNRASPVSRTGSGSSDEPIYEEIGDLNLRSHSPIYADAFDAKSIFDGASKTDILSFLESIRDRLTTSDSNSSGSPSSSISSKKGQESNYLVEENLSSSSSSTLLSTSSLTTLGCHLPTHPEEESEESAGLLAAATHKLVLRKLCPDCNDVPIEGGEKNDAINKLAETEENNLQTLCRSCNRKRSERKEIITEIHETEMKYGRDLAIISEEFYKPIQIAGLLNKEQLDQIFLNVGELMEISAQLTILLKTEISTAIVERCDEDLVSVNVGKLFLDFGESMMMAFQTYCTRQATAGALLAQLEKEKELLRIFLRVSQMENTVLRRMNLPAFLMVPVQRVTRYPLLLSRLLKVTPLDHFSRDELRFAHEKIELHLEHMNKATREVASVKLWRRISIINPNTTPIPRKSNNELEGASVSIKKMSIDVLDWTNLPDVSCIIDNQLGIFHFNGKPLRGIYACLLVRGKDIEALASKMDNDMFFPPAEDIVKEVKLVLVRVKNTRFCLLREPLCLSKCIVSQGENEFQDFVEINEITSKNTYYLQGIDKEATANWWKYMSCLSNCVGAFRRRRGALANIICFNGMLKHL